MTDKQSTALATVVGPDASWTEIVDDLVAQVGKNDLPDKVVQAAEYMIAGWPMHKISKELGVASDTLRRWLHTYPTMAVIVKNGRELLMKWRMSRLEQQFLTALDRSQEILDMPLDGQMADGVVANPKIVPVIAQQARFIIGLFAGQQVDVKVTHEMGDTVLKAKKDAMDYIAKQLAQQQKGVELEPIEAVYTVIDTKFDKQGPMLDENGNPAHGKLRDLDVNDDGILCHICGKRNQNLGRHILVYHGMSTPDYEAIFLLPDGIVERTEKNVFNL